MSKSIRFVPCAVQDTLKSIPPYHDIDIAFLCLDAAKQSQVVYSDPPEEVRALLEHQLQAVYTKICETGFCRCQVEGLSPVHIFRINVRQGTPFLLSILQDLDRRSRAYEASLEGKLHPPW